MTSLIQSWRKKTLPLIFQEELAECGHACIAMISHYFGKYLDLVSLRKLQPTTLKGVRLLDIIQLLQKLEFKTRALRISIDQLSQLQKPAILHWNANHFVVLSKVNSKGIVIHDPALGIRHCAWDEVTKSFTGIALEIQRTKDFMPLSQENRINLWDLMRVAKGFKKSLLLLLTLSLCIEGINLFYPLFIQYMTDDVLGTEHWGNLLAITGGFVLLLLFQLVIQYFRGQFVIFLTNSLREQLASNIMKYLLKLPLSFFEKRHKGDIQTKFNAIDQIQKKISTDFINTLLDGLLIMIHLIIMLIYSFVLTGLFFLAILIYAFIRYVSYRELKNQMEKSIVHHAKASSIFLEMLQGILSLKAFAKERTYFSLWHNQYIHCLNAEIKVARLQLKLNLSERFLNQVDYILLISVGSALTLSHHLSLGMLMAFLAYRQTVSTKLSSLIQNILDYYLLSIQVNRLNDILAQDLPKLSKNSEQNYRAFQELQLRDLSFSYEREGLSILHRINLKISAYEKVVIVGASGCGKSTLLKLMLALLEQTGGDLLIDGIRLQDYGLCNYQKLTASVLQGDTLLSGSIMDNITFFDEEIDREFAFDVAKLACIHETINQFPMGYDTLVGDMGSTLSGGQKQRILLARALYKKPKILFLDEATSHLDVETEIKINQALKALKMTQIIIAHRKETIDMADRIIDLENLNHKDR